MTNPTPDETRIGSYTEPFTQVQYGAFVKRNGEWYFTAAAWSRVEVLRKAREYYVRMNEHPQNNMDMDALNDIQIRKRSVTYGLWDEVVLP